MVSVHKRSSKSDPNNYGPIYMLSVVGKVLERVVVDLVCHHLNDNYLLLDQQFRPGRSTSGTLIFFTKSSQEAVNDGHDTFVVSHDIAEAFDRVWH